MAIKLPNCLNELITVAIFFSLSFFAFLKSLHQQQHRIRDGANNLFCFRLVRMRYAWTTKPLMKICVTDHKSDGNFTIKTQHKSKRKIYFWLSNRLSRLGFGVIKRSKIAGWLACCICFFFFSIAFKWKKKRSNNISSSNKNNR